MNKALLSLLLSFFLMLILGFDNPDSLIALNKGNTLYKKGKYKEALLEFNKAIGLDSVNAKAYYFRGLVYCKLNDKKKGLSDFNKSLKIDSTNALAYLERAKTRYYIEIELPFVKGVPYQEKSVDPIIINELFRDVNKSIAIDSTIADAYVWKIELMNADTFVDRVVADQRLWKKSWAEEKKQRILNYEQEIMYYTKAINLDSTDGTLYLNRGNLLLDMYRLQTGNHDLAEGSDSTRICLDFKKGASLNEINSIHCYCYYCTHHSDNKSRSECWNKDKIDK